MDESINILYLEPIQLQSSTLGTRDPEGKWDIQYIFSRKS